MCCGSPQPGLEDASRYSPRAQLKHPDQQETAPEKKTESSHGKIKSNLRMNAENIFNQFTNPYLLTFAHYNIVLITKQLATVDNEGFF